MIDLNYRRFIPIDLQSTPFDHSGNFPILADHPRIELGNIKLLHWLVTITIFTIPTYYHYLVNIFHNNKGNICGPLGLYRGIEPLLCLPIFHIQSWIIYGLSSPKVIILVVLSCPHHGSQHHQRISPFTHPSLIKR